MPDQLRMWTFPLGLMSQGSPCPPLEYCSSASPVMPAQTDYKIWFLPCSYLSLRTRVLVWHPSSPDGSLTPGPYCMAGFYVLMLPEPLPCSNVLQEPYASGIQDAYSALPLPRASSTSRLHLPTPAADLPCLPGERLA